MKSLKLLKQICYDTFQNEFRSTQCISVDCDSGHVFLATRDELVCLDPEKNEIVSEAPLNEFVGEENSSVATVVAMQHLQDEMALCLAFVTGDIVVYQIGTGTLECVGSVSSGVLAMAWSPDHELVVIVTGEQQLTIMNREFDPLLETHLHPDDFGEAKFVNVGWGKKETQFHGSEGKAAAKTKQDHSNVPIATANDDGKVRISWRGDGQYFAVSCLHRSKGCRVIRTWSRDGVHHSTSEILNGLEQALDWKPSGSLIASTQQLPQKHIVRFFERNGLVHGEFTIATEARVSELKWNNDSTILCLWYEKGEESVIQLWTVNNYHWYLKQELVQETKIGGFLWDPEHAYRLHLWSSDGRYTRYEWAWSTFFSHAYDETDLSCVAVIDGREVLVTPFKLAIVPPPMSGYRLKLPSPAQDVAFSPSSNRIVVLTGDRRLIIHDVIETCDGRSVDEERQYRIDMPLTLTSHVLLHHATLLDDDTLLLVSQTPDKRSTIHELKLTANPVITFNRSVPVDGNILAIRATKALVAVQLETGQVLKFVSTTGAVTPWLDSSGKGLSFPQPCTRMEICSFDNEEIALLGLTNRYRFYVNSLEVASNCTSFGVHEKFVLLTTHAHSIRCVPRCTGVGDLLKLSDGKAHPFDECVRRVERGSQIVTSLSSGTSVVLQMPRGNLETIHPRALVLTSVRTSLDQSRYDSAFRLMKKHRINMNLIHDHDPRRFLNETDIFVRQIGNADSLNIFLTELQEPDVTFTMYDAAYKDRKSGNLGTNKVDTICDKLRQTLIDSDRSKYFLSILTCYVKKRKPDLESALFEIRKMNDFEMAITSDEAMKYLLYLVDVNQLFDIALGTYDFDLVLMVAEKSQKDPKEYLPLLNRLRNMGENYRQFTIDRMLKRYSGALRNIVKCPDKFEECLKLIEEHDLYTEALSLYERGSDSYRRIARSQGLFLAEKKYFEEAGLAFWKGEEWEKAIDVFTKALCWRESLCMAQSGQLDVSRKRELALDLSTNLKSSGRFLEAALILETHLHDVEEAIATLIEGELWFEAMALIHRTNRLDFLETNLKPKMAESLEHHDEQLPEIRSQFEAYSSRLRAVRNEKERRHFELLNDPNYNDADADLFSDISSASGDSFLSKRTQSSFFSTSSRTNRAKRKADRKRFSLKPGSQNEDLALVDALAKLINRTEQLKTEIGPLLKILVLFDMTSEARKLQDALVDFLELIKTKIPEIWLEEESSEDFGSDSTAQAIALAAQQRRHILKAELNREPTLRSPPVLKSSQEWKLRTLKSER